MTKAPLTPQASPYRPRRRFAILIAIAVVVAAVFGRAVWGELVYDDLLVVQRNPLIGSLANVGEIFRSSYWDFLDADSAARVGYYRPLTTTFLTLAATVGGGSTVVFHLFSLAAHVLASFAAYLLLGRLARDERVGLWGGLLFALHPLHVESVAWISALGDPLFGLFGLLALHAFLRWRDDGSSGLPWAAGLWLLPALLSKDAAIAVIPAALAVDLGRRRGPAEGGGALGGLRPLVRGYAPLALAFLAYYGLRVATFGDWRGGFDRITTHFGVDAARLAWLRVELLGGYAHLAVWPGPLDLFRPFSPEISLADSGVLLALASATLWVAACAVAWRRGWRPALALLLLLPAALAPVLLRVQSLGTFPLSDRFLYLGVIGWTGLLAWLLARRFPPPLAVPALVLILGGYAWRDLARLPFWHDEQTMFESTLERNPRNPNAYWGLGRVLLQRYRHGGDLDVLARAREAFEDGMELLDEARADDLTVFATRDDHLQMNLGLGWCLFFEAENDPFHDYATPQEVFRRVTASYPESERGYTGLGATLLRQNRFDEAGEALRTALRINPRSVEALHDMGQLLRVMGDLEGAELLFLQAMKIRQDDYQDLMGLAQTLFGQGRMDEAADLALKTNGLYPQYAGPLVLLGTISNARGKFSDALRWLDRALRSAPESGLVHFEYAQVLSALGRTADALPHYERAWAERSGDFQVAYQYGRALLLQGRQEDAVGPLVRAYSLRSHNPVGQTLHDELLGLRPGDITLQWSLASVSAQRKDWSIARGWCERALAIDSEHGPSHFLMGLVLRELGELELSAQHLLDACRLMADHFYSHLECGTALLALERPAQALPFLQRALELLPLETSLTDEQRVKQANTLREEIEKVRAAVGG